MGIFSQQCRASCSKGIRSAQIVERRKTFAPGLGIKLGARQPGWCSCPCPRLCLQCWEVQKAAKSWAAKLPREKCVHNPAGYCSLGRYLSLLQFCWQLMQQVILAAPRQQSPSCLLTQEVNNVPSCDSSNDALMCVEYIKPQRGQVIIPCRGKLLAASYRILLLCSLLLSKVPTFQSFYPTHSTFGSGISLLVSGLYQSFHILCG